MRFYLFICSNIQYEVQYLQNFTRIYQIQLNFKHSKIIDISQLWFLTKLCQLQLLPLSKLTRIEAHPLLLSKSTEINQK